MRHRSGNDDHRSLLERVEEKLSRLLGDDRAERSPDSRRADDGEAGVPEPYAYDREGDLRLFGGPHVDAPGWDPSFPGPRFDRIDVGSVGTHAAHPVSSFYGAGYGIGASGYSGSSAREYYLAMRRQGQQHDPHYAHWRDSEMQRIDRDYDEYRRERQAQFNQEFDGWRSKRQEKRRALGRVKRDMDVVGRDGQLIGKVETVAGDDILVRQGDNAGGPPHPIPFTWIEIVDVRVEIDRSAREAQQSWQEAQNERGPSSKSEPLDRRPEPAGSPPTRRSSSAEHAREQALLGRLHAGRGLGHDTGQRRVGRDPGVLHLLGECGTEALV
jgi:hypothetical protein